ncbi:MAG: hypothetical protein NVS3B17_22840 [Vulcanimicrobiaceae bacterium]
MIRSAFLSSVAATLATTSLASAGELVGASLTQRELFATLPAARPGQWTRVILGSGAKYQKQIGVGSEANTSGHVAYFETQVGMPGGSCNPASMRKAYLKSPRIGSLLDEYALSINIGRTENMIYRYGDEAAGHAGVDNTFHLLDERFLYDSRPMHVVSATRTRLHVASAMHDVTHVVGEYRTPGSGNDRLQHVEVWYAPEFPFGVAKYRATLRGLDPFEMYVYSHGDRFATMLAMKLDDVRAATKDGQYGQIPTRGIAN